MRLEKEHAELQQIQADKGGLLKPDDVVERARNPDSALHQHFTWDDTEAARLHRLDQARRLIQLVVTIVGENPEPVRAFVSVPSDRTRGGGYRAIEDVLTDETRRAEVLRDFFERLAALRRKYARFSELAPIFTAADSVEQAAVQQQPQPERAAG